LNAVLVDVCLKRKPVVLAEPLIPVIPPCGKTYFSKRFRQKSPKTLAVNQKFK
jgi:hypothetical protein